MRTRRLWILLVLFGVTATLAGCKTIQRHDAEATEELLAAAGFRQFPATTPERINALATMKPRTFKLVNRHGKDFYVYPDPTNCNCLYAGTQAQYQAYRKLALEKEITEENLETAEAAEAASVNWGVWGPW